MSNTKQMAIEMINRLPEDRLVDIINVLKSALYAPAHKDDAMDAYRGMQEFWGCLPSDFDADKELAEAREAKYGRIG